MEPTRTPSAEVIHEQLERVLASAPFANAQRSQKFLRYIVECSLNNQDEFLKEFAIAVDVYGRNVSYDPSINATVRVEAGRLRSRLREYYTGEGLHDPLIIDVPKGGYRVTFSERSGSSNATVTQPAVYDSIPPTTQVQKAFWRRLAPLLLAAIILLAAIGMIAYLKIRTARAMPAGTDHGVLRVLPFSSHPVSAQLIGGPTKSILRVSAQEGLTLFVQHG